MSLRIGLDRRVGLASIVAVLVCSVAGCSKGTAETTRERLRGFIDNIRVINTHEHQRIPPDYNERNYNFYSILASTYLESDLVSAGAPEFEADVVERGNLDELWDIYGRYLDFSRNTSYYSHFLAGFRILYGFDEPYFTQPGIADLSERIAENYRNREEWYQRAVDKAGFDIMFLDQYWANFNIDIDNRYFALVFNINSLVSSVSDPSMPAAGDESDLNDTYVVAEKEGHSIETLDDYLGFADHMFGEFIEHGAVCLKNSLAYSRSLDFQDVSREEAKELFERRSQGLSDGEKKNLQDFMFHWIIEKSVEVNLPIQIHTGYLAGNGNTLENSRPTKLSNLFLSYPEARFVLFHGGYPWTGEFAALGKMFPNVYLDLVWLPQISRESAVKGLDEMLDGVPYNKLFWGGDCHFIEESTGSLEFGKDVVAEVLAARVERKLMTEEVARDVALEIFRENAIRFFNLEARLVQ
jgi:hypothetical protein